MRRAALVYPEHQIKPVDFLDFIETRVFTSLWSRLGLDDDDLEMLQVLVMSNPTGPAVIAGTGGARKMRFKPVDWPRGKSSALRVIYAVFPEHSTVGLGLVYPKSIKDNLTSNEKKSVKKALHEIERELAREP